MTRIDITFREKKKANIFNVDQTPLRLRDADRISTFVNAAAVGGSQNMLQNAPIIVDL